MNSYNYKLLVSKDENLAIIVYNNFMFSTINISDKNLPVLD
jgi:hypothetical protein